MDFIKKETEIHQYLTRDLLLLYDFRNFIFKTDTDLKESHAGCKGGILYPPHPVRDPLSSISTFIITHWAFQHEYVGGAT